MKSCSCGRSFQKRVRVSKQVSRGADQIARAKKFDRIAKLTENAVSANLLKGIQSFQNRISSNEIEQLIEEGRQDEVFRSIPFDSLDEELEPVKPEIKQAMLNAGAAALEEIKPQRKSIRFDTANPRIDRYIEDNVGLLIKQISEETRLNVTDTVRASFDRGLTPKATAKLVKKHVGLLPKQKESVMRSMMTMYVERDAAIRKLDQLVNEGKGSSPRAQNLRGKIRSLSEKNIEKKTLRLADQKLEYRARMIARTETNRAVNAGQEELWQQGVESGSIDPEKAWKEWVTVNDMDRSPICTTLANKRVRLDEQFYIVQTGENVPHPPAHPNCRSSVTIVFEE